MRRNNINAMLIVVVTTSACILPACGGGGGGGGSPSAVSECSSVTYRAPSGTANNIVFTFDQPYVCGQYANRDWWVAPLTNGGTVTINSITPTQTTRVATSHVMNGAMVNPTSAVLQGFDGDVPPGTNYSSGLTATLPLVVNTTTVPITSVIKAASISGVASGNNPQFQFAAVLTVIAASGDMTAQFRPSFFDVSANKFQVAVSSINVSSLGTVDLSSVSAVTAYTFSNVATATAGLQLDFFNTYINQHLHAKDNSYTVLGGSGNGTGYGSEASILYGKNMLRFAANDFNYSNPTHKQALINYLQWCIDLAGDVNGGTSFTGAGGYGYGRKLALLFGGQVLGNTAISNLGLAANGTFGEDTSLFVSTQTGKVLHGEVSSGAWGYPDSYWQYGVTGVGSKTTRDPMGWVDDGGGNAVGAYLMCCVAAPARYQAMAAQMFGLGSADSNKFNQVLLLSNRIQNHGLQFLPDPYAPYDGIPGNQDITWGLNSVSGYFFTGAGRYPSVDGKTLSITHTDPMGEAVWTYWIGTHDITPPTDISDLVATQPLVHENVLNWTATGGTDHYNIYRATDAYLLNPSLLNTSATNSYTDSGLTPGNTYGYYVQSADAAGNLSNLSNKATGKSN